MPIYEYKCKKCGYRFEQLQKVTDKPLSTCPKCKKTQLVKLVSNTSFQLKGTGWYVTDFKNKTVPDKKLKRKKPKLQKNLKV
ncbi:MAG: zinc ribbon domain-containing protein [Coxiellaceae bacterium]|jgi:putative FmdB family regulatory protein|nr:zinc ribbon domain-containing protein [Coxiellaceae bacterium]